LLSSAESAFLLRQEFDDLRNDVSDDVQPIDEVDFNGVPVKSSWGRFGGYELVGNGKITNGYCGSFAHFRGCVNVDGHNVVDVYGRDFRGKVAFERVFCSCDRPSCPICYRRGWAIREAHRVADRLNVASKRWGKVEHIVVSLPEKDYGFKTLALACNKVAKVLLVRHIVGGVSLFHPARYSVQRGWYFSPHMHVLGFLVGGYDRCRKCVKQFCSECGGFEGLTRRENDKDGYIVKVLGERTSVLWTAAYQLNHSGYDVHAKRANIARWFGVASYRKLKVSVERHKELCPICGEEFTRILCLVDVKDVPVGEGVLFDFMLNPDGSPRWCEGASGYHV